MFNYDSVLTIDDFFKHYDEIGDHKEYIFDRALCILDSYIKGGTCLYLYREEAEKLLSFARNPHCFYLVDGKDYDFKYKGHKGVIRKDKKNEI